MIFFDIFDSFSLHYFDIDSISVIKIILRDGYSVPIFMLLSIIAMHFINDKNRKNFLPKFSTTFPRHL